MKLLFDFPQCFLVPIFVAVIFAVMDIVLTNEFQNYSSLIFLFQLFFFFYI